MLILSQSRTVLENFNNSDSLYIKKHEEVYMVTSRHGQTDIGLGAYLTEERAKEVIQGIIKTYSRCLLTYVRDRGALIQSNLPRIYRMPIE